MPTRTRVPADPRSGHTPTAEELAATKAALRASALRARRDLSAGERQRAAERAVTRLAALPEVHRARVVLLYAAMRDELDPAGLLPILAERGVRSVFPRVRGDGLELAAASDPRSLRPGYRGIREPVGPAFDPELVDVAVVPGVAFDVTGGRIGQGGGHYDRLLPQLSERSLRIGACFACQVVPRVPRGGHDALVDVVVTERAAYRTRART